MMRRLFRSKQTLKDQVQSLMDEGQLSRAEDLLNSKLEGGNHTERSEVTKLLALVRWRRDGADGAIDLLHQFHGDGSGDQESHQLLGRLLMSRERFEEALRLLEGACSTWPDSAGLHVLRGVSLVRLGEQDTGKLALAKAISLQPVNPDARLELVLLECSMGHEGSAEQILHDYMEIAPGLASSHAFMADYYLFQRLASQRSLPYYEKALALSPKHKEWYSSFWSTSGYPESIIESYLFALEEASLSGLARKVTLQELDGAEQEFFLGYLHEKSGDYSAAAHHYGRASEASPRNSEFLRRMALATAANGKTDAALDILIRAQNESPKTADIQRTTGLISALQEHRMELTKHPQSREPSDELLPKQVLLGRLEYQEAVGHWMKASHTTSELLRHNSEDQWVRRARANAYRHLGRYDEAVADLRIAVDLAPEYFLAWRDLAKTGLLKRDRQLVDEALAAARGLPELTHGQKKILKELEGDARRDGIL